MKKSCKILIVLLMAACMGSCGGYGCADNSSAVLENIMTRTSIRAFAETPVEEAKIEALLRAGMAAPSAVNRQPWAFVVVTGRENLDRLKEGHPNARMLGTAQAAIVVCGDMTKAISGQMGEYWIQDASAATENILLAAHALGLGAVWTGVYPNPNVMPNVSAALELPSHIVPLCVIPIGYPAESPTPKDKWNPGNVHYNRW
ncbi:MAG: nitroreductase family protein [Alistipes sp.]|nr:nitroreductase family protein [Alistipes sp.]